MPKKQRQQVVPVLESPVRDGEANAAGNGEDEDAIYQLSVRREEDELLVRGAGLAAKPSSASCALAWAPA